MAGYRIDINDGRNAPVKPLEPPGGGAIPATAVPQANNEASLEAAIAEGVSDGIAAHVAAPDPHPQYLLDSEVPGAQLIPLVTGGVPAVLVYLEDGTLVYVASDL
jgi:hypothetical protein